MKREDVGDWVGLTLVGVGVGVMYWPAALIYAGLVLVGMNILKGWADR